jgi:hypothetical protein
MNNKTIKIKKKKRCGIEEDRPGIHKRKKHQFRRAGVWLMLCSACLANVRP